MEEILFRRLNAVPNGGAVDPVRALATATTLAELGYIVDPRQIDDATFEYVERNIDFIKSLLGDHVAHAHLFEGFPNKLPERDNIVVRVAVYFFRDLGFAIDGWWPDSSIPLTEEHYEKMSTLNLKGDDVSELRPLKTVNMEDVNTRIVEWGQAAIMRPYSLRKDEIEDVKLVLESLDFSKVTFLETKALFAEHFWVNNQSKLASILHRPDDFLRLFAALNNEDISLATKISLPKFKRSQRKLIVNILDKVLENKTLINDMFSKRGLWLTVGKHLRVGEHQKARNVQFAFDRLRSDDPLEASFNSKLESAITNNEEASVLSMLESRPGEFARRIRECLNRFDSNKVLEAFGRVIDSVPLGTLYVLHGRNRNNSEELMVVNKKGTVIFVEPNFKLEEIVEKELNKLIEASAVKRLADGSSGTVQFTADLDKVILPLQQRSSSDGLLTLERGSRLNNEPTKTLRLFVYWVGQDLDLSVLLLDKNFNLVSQVSWTNLADSGITHSGDITHAPKGASEFIDVQLNKLNSDVAYIVPQVYNYAGPAFDDIESFTGWMWRNKTDNKTAAFDAKTVANKLVLNGSARTICPFIYDIHARETIVVDCPLHSFGYGQSTENMRTSSSQLAEHIANFTQLKPTVGQVLADWVSANDLEIVEENGDYVFGLDSSVSELLRR